MNIAIQNKTFKSTKPYANALIEWQWQHCFDDVYEAFVKVSIVADVDDIEHAYKIPLANGISEESVKASEDEVEKRILLLGIVHKTLDKAQEALSELYSPIKLPSGKINKFFSRLEIE